MAQKKKINVHDVVEVENISAGTLVYISKKDGSEWIFERPHDTQLMEIQELVHMKGSNKAFFQNQWVKVLDPEVEKYLHLGQYYKNALNQEDIDKLFELEADELEHMIDKVVAGTKIAILKTARDKFESGELTNVRLIKVIEKKFKVQLIEND